MTLQIALFFALWVGMAVGRPLVSKVDYRIYHKIDDLMEEVKAVVRDHPGSMNIEEKTRSQGDYSAPLTVLSSKQAGLSTPDDDKMRVLMSFGEHGRELITTEVGLSFIKAMSDKSEIRKVFGPGDRSDELVDLMDRISFKIFPNENSNGRNLVEGGKLCERRNGRGVDPNRNWDVDFGVKEPDYDPKEENPGAFAFSEPEVQMLHEVAKDFEPHVWVNVHSGMEAIFMPYDHQGFMPNGTDADKQFEMIKTLKNDMCESCAIGSGGKTVGYLAHGTATDYMYTRLHVPLAFTWEIYGDMNALHEDCFKMFNPTTKEEFDDVVDQWTKTLFRLLELLPSHPALQQFAQSNANVSTVAETNADQQQESAIAHTTQQASPIRVIGPPISQELHPVPKDGYWLYGTAAILTTIIITFALLRRRKNRTSQQRWRDQ
ncbi:hypothetical protein BSKO_01457 [Bryopsis sp. KO-2023]|nr:hypothetical protein BSKO_01457 [Bryopsis sp. KO-2023]